MQAEIILISIGQIFFYEVNLNNISENQTANERPFSTWKRWNGRIAFTAALITVAGFLFKGQELFTPYIDSWISLPDRVQKLESLKLLPEPKGDKGPKGAVGPKGEKGDPGDLKIVDGEIAFINACKKRALDYFKKDASFLLISEDVGRSGKSKNIYAKLIVPRKGMGPERYDVYCDKNADGLISYRVRSSS